MRLQKSLQVSMPHMFTFSGIRDSAKSEAIARHMNDRLPLAATGCPFTVSRVADT